MTQSRGLIGFSAMLVGNIVSGQTQDMPGYTGDDPLNSYEGVIVNAQEQVWLHWMTLSICLIIFAVVFGLMLYSILVYRNKSRSAKLSLFHTHFIVEVAWTIIPFIIIIAMVLPAIRIVVTMKDASNLDAAIKVKRGQWKWGYECMDGAARYVESLHGPLTPLVQMRGYDAPDQSYLTVVSSPVVVLIDKNDIYCANR